MTLPSQCPGCTASVPPPETVGPLPYCSPLCQEAAEVREALMEAAMPRGCQSCGAVFESQMYFTLNRLQRKTLDGRFCDLECWETELAHQSVDASMRALEYR